MYHLVSTEEKHKTSLQLHTQNELRTCKNRAWKNSKYKLLVHGWPVLNDLSCGVMHVHVHVLPEIGNEDCQSNQEWLDKTQERRQSW